MKVFAALLHTHLAGTDENNKNLARVKQDLKQTSLTSSTIRFADLRKQFSGTKGSANSSSAVFVYIFYQ